MGPVARGLPRGNCESRKQTRPATPTSVRRAVHRRSAAMAGAFRCQGSFADTADPDDADQDWYRYTLMVLIGVGAVDVVRRLVCCVSWLRRPSNWRQEVFGQPVNRALRKGRRLARIIAE